jgi:hypothetical protein
MNELRSYSFDFINFENQANSFQLEILNLQLKWLLCAFIAFSFIQIVFELNFSMLSLTIAIILLLLGFVGLVLINKYRLNEVEIYRIIEKGYYFFLYTFLCHLIDITLVIYLNKPYTLPSHDEKYERFFNKITTIFTIQMTFLLLYTLSFLRRVLSEKK